MLRRETAIEFPDIERGQALRGLQSAASPSRCAREAAPQRRVESLERLAALRDRGAITDDEYQAEKTLVITNGT